MSRTLVIAEIGVNHNGEFRAALELIDAAKGAGADIAKFQLFSSQKLWGDDRIKNLELSQEQMKDIAAYCKSVGIEFLCTPFDVESLDYLVSLKVQRLKIASGCLGKFDLLYAAHQSGLPVILSTGMSDAKDIHRALDTLASNVTLLHCTSSYPCKLEDVNLKAIQTLETLYGLPVGYSDHTNGITVAIAAVAMGATVIEKHLTLDRNQEGADHKASINPREFKAMKMAIMEVEYALGDGVKRVMKCEEPLRKAWRT
ncbi:MAG: N-acetylneuraminate synthase family protein [Candidatus Binatia bacterium]|nr:N-acetylneuraminate synthase family protein [Candidatus Binatia bacterium]